MFPFKSREQNEEVGRISVAIGNVPEFDSCFGEFYSKLDLYNNWNLKIILHIFLESSVMTGDTLKSSTSTLKKNKKAAVEEKFAETQEYLRKPNVLYPPWPSSPPTEHYHTLPSNLHHVHHPSPHHHNHHSHHHHHLSPRLYHGGPDSTGGNCCDKRSTTGNYGHNHL